MLTEGIDYFIYYREMPPKIYAFIMVNNDSTYSIFLDPRRDYQHRLEDLKHELDHIRNNDFYNGSPIQAVEDYL